MPPVCDDVAQTHDTLYGWSSSQIRATVRYAVPITVRQSHMGQLSTEIPSLPYAGLRAAPVSCPYIQWLINIQWASRKLLRQDTAPKCIWHVAYLFTVLLYITRKPQQRPACWVSP